MHEKMKIKQVLTRILFRGPKNEIKHLEFINDSFLFYFRFFEQLNRIRVIQNMFYFHLFMHIKISFTSKMFYLLYLPVKIQKMKKLKILLSLGFCSKFTLALGKSNTVLVTGTKLVITI